MSDDVYINVTTSTEKSTSQVSVAPNVILDYGPDGKLIGVEVHGAVSVEINGRVVG